MENADLLEDFQGELREEERNFAILSHLGVIATFFFPMGNIILPLLVWLIKKDESAYIEKQAKEALNFQITMTILGVFAAILCLILIGFFVLFGLFVVSFIFSVLAAISASKGEYYEYPLNFRLIK